MRGRRPTVPLLLLPLLLAVAAEGTVPVPQDGCPRRAPAARYSSKTAYQLVHGGDVAPQDTVQGCRAVYLWHLLRHGTRYPSSNEITKLTGKIPALQAALERNVAAGRGSLCAEAVSRMLSWTLNATYSQSNDLQYQGQMDLLEIGQRFKKRYPTFLRGQDRTAFSFRSTEARRTQESAAWYGRGLLDAEVRPVSDDELLKFYAFCPAWDRAVDTNASARAEVTKFQEGSVVKAALERVSHRLGFLKTLSYEEVDLLWEACRYDQAWDPNVEGTWCAAFDQEALQAFEYRADLKYYYVGGYGNAMDLQLGCPLVKDLVDKLSAFERGDTASATRKGDVYFTHSTAIHMTMARLGIGRDGTPLTADNYEAMRVRKWSISRLGPFAANIAVVLYECPRGERHKMRMLVNERPILLEGCDDADALCSWSDFKRRFAAIADSCTLDFCQRGAADGPSTLSMWAAAAAVLAVLVR